MMRDVAWAGFVLGLALAGFVDGILLHQILQWHHMLSAVDDPAVAGDLSLNVLADGLFHLGALALAVLGSVLLWRARTTLAGAGRSLGGMILLGAGVFNLVEGLVNHHLLGIHHVRTDVAGPLPWDVGFLALSAAFAAAGWAIARRRVTRADDSAVSPLPAHAGRGSQATARERGAGPGSRRQ